MHEYTWVKYPLDNSNDIDIEKLAKKRIKRYEVLEIRKNNKMVLSHWRWTQRLFANGKEVKS